jgi:uncharacterized protein YaiE (UPF0345 family)
MATKKPATKATTKKTPSKQSVLTEYFEGGLKSLKNERHGRDFSVGIFSPGEYHLGTAKAEKMYVTCGELQVKLDGSKEFVTYAAGTCFEVGPNSGFTAKATHATAYHCEYL